MPPTKKNHLPSVTPAKNNQIKATPLQTKPREVDSSEWKESALGWALLSAFQNGGRGAATVKRISKGDVSRLIEDMRHNRVPILKNNGHELIVLKVAISPESQIRVSLALKMGGANALLKVARENQVGFSSILEGICGKVNNVSGRLAKLAAKDILIQSDKISANRHTADIVLKSDLIIFT